MQDLSLVSESISGSCTWETWEELNSDHKPIMIEVECEKETNQGKKGHGRIYIRRKLNSGEV